MLNGATGGATGPVLDAGDRALAPVHSAVCSPAHDILGQLPGLSGQDAGQDEEGTEQASPEGSSQEGSEESTADESTAGQTPDVDSAAASDEGGATQEVAAPGATSTTDLPVEVPAAS